VLTVIVELAVEVVELSVTEGPAVHLGKLTAPAGEEVSAQVKATVPAYPPVPDTVRVDDAVEPAAIFPGLVAVIVNAGGPVLPVTVTAAVPVAEA
jgi:hypothetical protein